MTIKKLITELLEWDMETEVYVWDAKQDKAVKLEDLTPHQDQEGVLISN